MARFDVHEMKDGSGLVVDCQADILAGLGTRLVVPLMPIEAAPRPFARLNPPVEVGGARFLFVPQHAASVQVSELGRVVESLAAEDMAISNAFDMLLTGY